MAESIGITAVKWCWRSDTTWVEIDQALAYKLEFAYHSTETSDKVKKIRVDKERFIDLTLNTPEIKKQFQKVDCKDSELVGIQRRYDDESKRRAVKRCTPLVLFKGVNAFIALDDEEDEIFNTLRAHGATISQKSVIKATKVVITSQKEATNQESNYAGDIAKAQNFDIPIVKLECLIDALKNEDELDFENKKYQIKFVDTKAEQEKLEQEKNLKAVKKRKLETEDEEEETPVEKKRKTIVKSTESKSEPAAIKSSNNETNNSSNQSSTKAESSGLPVMIYVPSSWAGVCSYGVDEDYPFRVELASLRGTKMTGTVEWPTLGHAKTKLRGTIDGNSFKFEEYEAITGADSVQIPSFYSGLIKNNGKTIEGKTVSGADDDGGDDDSAKFKIDLVNADESSEEEYHSILKNGARFNGTSFVENSFSISISNRSGNDISGTVTWDDTKTENKFKGTAEENKLVFEEDNDDGYKFEGVVSSAGVLEGTCISKNSSNPKKRFEIQLYK